jgi:hypothetical protein
MKLEDIENLSFAELKEQRAELLKHINGNPLDAVAERYLQARMDAKQRDEKLSEQGKTITLLQAGHGTLDKQLHEANAALTETMQANEMAVVEIERLRGLLRSETDRSERLKVQASKHQFALTGAAKLLNDAISMGQIEQAETGE